LERQGDGLFAPLIEDRSKRSVSPGDGKPQVTPAFLFGEREPPDPAANSRVEFSAWITDRQNAYFSRSAVNRIWALMFGVGLVQPIDDFHDKNPPSHAEILDDLANAFVANGYDFDIIFRTICRTKAYQRTSACPVENVSDARRFARMLTKGLSADQAWDSLIQAVGWIRSNDDQEGAASERSIGRRRFFEQFTPRSWPAEPETSVSQALALMNGKLLARATSLDQSPTLIAAIETPGWTDDERLHVVYLATVSRPPTSGELDRLRTFVAASGPEQCRQRFEDILWVLLNSSEFRLNH
jgi:hypothetical protein